MLRKRVKLNQKGFTMVELLAAITILAVVTLIAIKGVSGMIERAKTEKEEEQQKVLTIAAESYLQANSQYKPKTIGEAKYIEVQKLKDANYLKSDITNANGDSCMSNSVVRVYKLSKTEYSYYPYLYCGDEERPASIEPPEAYATAYFTDARGKRYGGDDYNPNNIMRYEDISKARIKITVRGHKTEDIPIDGYSYAIESVDKTGRRTIYDSGSLSANRNTEVEVFFDLKDYVDLADGTDFYLKVFVRNIHGGIYEIDSLIESPGSRGSYKDNTAPNCASIQNQAAEGEWINKNSAVQERTITVYCEDGDGSGCVRDTFSRTWPSTHQKSAEFGYVQIRDNAGNYNPDPSRVLHGDYLSSTCDPNDFYSNHECCVRVNVDLVSPSVYVVGYKAKADGKETGEPIYSQSDIETYEESPDTYYISSTKFSRNVDGWLNHKNYPDGVVFKVNMSDDIGIASYKWETNPSEIKDPNDPNTKIVAMGNPDSLEWTFDNRNRKKEAKNIYVGFSENGIRKGVLSVTDIAGNTTTYIIETNVAKDDICIGCGTGTTSGKVKADLLLNKFAGPDNKNLGEVYEPKTWSNLSVIASPSPEVAEFVEETYGSYFYYSVKLDQERNDGFKDTGAMRTRNSLYYFDNSLEATSNGKNVIKLTACDQAGNCEESDEYEVWIDTVAPECIIESKTSKGQDYYDGHWLKKGINAKVTASCSDVKYKNRNYTISDCIEPLSFSYEYKNNINTMYAGAKGANKNDNGSVSDLAGNVTKCTGNIEVKIDHDDPTCTTTATNGSSTYNGNWINGSATNTTVTVTNACSDPFSGCMVATKTSASYKPNTTKANATINYDTDSSRNGFGSTATVYAIDEAGNYAPCTNTPVKIDITPPVCKTAENAKSKGQWRNTDVTIKQNFTDATSGCRNGKCYVSTSYTKDTGYDNVYVYDVAGNRNKCGYYVNLDKTKPECNGTTEADPTTSATSRTRGVYCNDDKKGTLSIYSGCTQNSFSKTWTYSDSKIETGNIQIKDNAGNTNDCSVIVNVDDDDPKEICPLKNESDLFGKAIDLYGSTYGPVTLSSSRDVTYKHIDLGNSGDGTTEYTLTVKNTNKIYNYYPIKYGNSNTTPLLTFNKGGSYGTVPYAFGFKATWGGTTTYGGEPSDDDWCFANGSRCKGTHWCYARVCVNEEKCGKYLGWTADKMNAEINKAKCPCKNSSGNVIKCFARCWCQCNVTTDWYN